MRRHQRRERVAGALALTCQLLACGPQDGPSQGHAELPSGADRADEAPADPVPPAELIRALASPERELRLHAIRGLSGSESLEALAALVELLKREPDPELRKLAQEAVTGWQDPKLREHLELALLAPEAELRAKAATGLAGLGGDASIPSLRAALESEPDAAVRAALRRALEGLGAAGNPGGPP